MLHWLIVALFSNLHGAWRRSGFVIGLCFLLAALAPDGAAQTQLTPDVSELPKFDNSLSGVPPAIPEAKPFRVGIGDVLQISVWREPEVSVQAVTVRSDGKISVPLIKEVYVSGLTPLEIEQEMTRKFERFINNPVVTVIVRETHSQQVILSGGVARPGLLEIQPGMTVMHAIAIAGGLHEYAKKNKIFVIRGKGSQQVMLPFDYKAVISGKDPSKDFLLEPGDMIVVPQ